MPRGIAIRGEQCLGGTAWSGFGGARRAVDAAVAEPACSLTVNASGNRIRVSRYTCAPTPAVWCVNENLPLMGTEYPEELLAREPAPPYAGEGPFALWHFSEDPSLGRFRPHVPATNPGAPPLVWAVDTRHAPMFWFPRDCPRGCIWPVSTTTPRDRERFFGQTAATRIHVVEADWLDRVRTCTLYAYRLPAVAFRPHHTVGGYWVADQPVEAVDQVVIDDLPGRHAAARIELRITPSIWPFWRRVTASTVEFSGSRLGNAGVPEP